MDDEKKLSNKLLLATNQLLDHNDITKALANDIEDLLNNIPDDDNFLKKKRLARKLVKMHYIKRDKKILKRRQFHISNYHLTLLEQYSKEKNFNSRSLALRTILDKHFNIND